MLFVRSVNNRLYFIFPFSIFLFIFFLFLFLFYLELEFNMTLWLPLSQTCYTMCYSSHMSHDDVTVTVTWS